MRFPNKVTPYRKSIISKFPILIADLEKSDCSVYELYKKNEKRFDGINEYVDALDCLFYLGKIELLPGGMKLHYVKRDLL